MVAAPRSVWTSVRCRGRMGGARPWRQRGGRGHRRRIRAGGRAAAGLHDRRRRFHSVARGAKRPHVRPQRLRPFSRRARSPAASMRPKLERGPSCPVRRRGSSPAGKMCISRFGRLPWRDLFARAIELADRGFPASPGLAAQTTATYRALLEQDPGATQLFLRNGPRQVRDAVPATRARRDARRARARRRARRSIAARPLPALRATSDPRRLRCCGRLCRHAPPTGSTRSSRTIAAYDVRVMPPNSYGLFMLLQLIALDDIDSRNVEANAPERYAALIAAAHTAFAAGDSMCADPSVAGRPLDTILSEQGIASVRADFRKRAWTALPNRGGTRWSRSPMSRAMAPRSCRACSWSTVRAWPTRTAAFCSTIACSGSTLAAGHPNAVARQAAGAHAQSGHDIRRRFASSRAADAREARARP